MCIRDSYRIKKAEEGIDFKNSQSVILYSKRIMDIISDLDPIEKDVYIKKASENTGIKEQALYDILKIKMKDKMCIRDRIYSYNWSL